MPSPPPVPSPGSLGLRALNVLTRAHVSAYRRTGGRVGRRLAGAPVLLLDHVGRRSGERRTTPLLYLEDGEDLVIAFERGQEGLERKADVTWAHFVKLYGAHGFRG